MQSSLDCLIALTEVESIGPVLANRLIDFFGSPEHIFKASLTNLLQVEGINEARARRIRNFKGWKRVEEIFRICKRKDIKIVDIYSKEYPEQLRAIPDPPLVLYIKGILEDTDRASIAVVGPRRASTYGKTVTERLVSELSSMGITIVSGLARGIDTVAHRSAIDSGGRTIAVLGSGIDVPYPPENRALMKKIFNKGAVISEFPPGTKPDRGNFPRRNRIISGLSLGVLVVEARRKSGALITARFALEQGRDIFAVPGRITSELSLGTNDLIRKGAKTVLTVKDIVEELSEQFKEIINERARETRNYDLNNDEKALLELLTDEPVHVDDLTRMSTLPLYKILGVLTSLELKGLVKQAEGKRFYKIREVC